MNNIEEFQAALTALQYQNLDAQECLYLIYCEKKMTRMKNKLVEIYNEK
jgi:hypothetical protein